MGVRFTPFRGSDGRQMWRSGIEISNPGYRQCNVRESDESLIQGIFTPESQRFLTERQLNSVVGVPDRPSSE
jgi:hypothetical protein